MLYTLLLHPMPVPVFGSESAEIYIWLCIFMFIWVFGLFLGKKKRTEARDLATYRHDKLIQEILNLEEKLDQLLDKDV